VECSPHWALAPFTAYIVYSRRGNSYLLHNPHRSSLVFFEAGMQVMWGPLWGLPRRRVGRSPPSSTDWAAISMWFPW
jgi:hypothetical protein